MSDKYSIILPTYNEKENLPIITFLIFETADKHQLNIEIIIVDDNSPDGTALIAEELVKQYGDNRITLHKRPGKLGLGSAYIAGLQFCKGNFIILMDADLSHHPKYLPEFIKLQKTENCEIVTGTRYKEKGGVFGWDFRRKLTSRVANFIAKTLLGSDCSDLTGSFRLYKREVFDKIMKQVVSKGYAFQMEIIIRAQAMDYKVKEVPIIFVDRIFGESKLGANEVLIYLKGVWNLFCKI